MTDSTDIPAASTSGSGASQPARAAFLPSRGIGWAGVALTLAGIAALATAMVMAGIANDPSAVNGAIMIASIVLVVAGLIASILCVTVWRQRSVLNIVALAVSVPTVGLLTVLILAGFFNGVL